MAYETSWLNAAATRVNLLEKAQSTQASVVVFDLEDALPKDQKVAGRHAYRAAFHARGDKATRIAVRINSLASSLGLEDLLFLLTEQIVPDIIILPRSGWARDISIVAELISDANPNLKVYSVIESLQGFRALRELPPVTKFFGGLILGSADLAADLGIQLRRSNLDFYRSELAFAAKSIGIAAIDAPCFQIDNESALISECEAALRMGFDGKIAVHPNQVPIINGVFGVSQDALSYAHDIISRHTKDAISHVNGDMTGPPFVRYAEKVIRRAHTMSRTGTEHNE